MVRRQVLHQHKGHAGVVGHARKEGFKRCQTPCRGADADDGEGCAHDIFRRSYGAVSGRRGLGMGLPGSFSACHACFPHSIRKIRRKRPIEDSRRLAAVRVLSTG